MSLDYDNPWYDTQEEARAETARAGEPNTPRRPSALVFAIDEGCTVNGRHYREDNRR